MWKKVFGISLLALFFVLSISGCCRPPLLSSVSANLKIAQHTNTWCWAASTDMITDYYGHRIFQCDSSKFVHNNPADCSTGCAGYCSCWSVTNQPGCNQGGCGATIAQIQNNWTHWNFAYSYTASSLSWEKLKETISTSPYCDRSPIQTIWWWTNGGGHVVTAYAYAEAGGQKYVAYYNPWPPDCNNECKTDGNHCQAGIGGGDDAVSTYEAYVSSAAHQWGNSFYKFKYTTP